MAPVDASIKIADSATTWGPWGQPVSAAETVIEEKLNPLNNTITDKNTTNTELNNFFISSSVLAIDNPPVLDMIEIDNVYRFIRTEL